VESCAEDQQWRRHPARGGGELCGGGLASRHGGGREPRTRQLGGEGGGAGVGASTADRGREPAQKVSDLSER
jgi:hypothetical protein